jgi:uncharacterized protein YdeI (YjbR/CyaY-like superfamily)
MAVCFFDSKEALRAWFNANAATEPEVILAFYKKRSSKQGVSYDDAVIEGLRVGWIDSLTRRIDNESYSIRFTPRKPNGNWTARNIARVEEMIANGDNHPLGLAAFNRRPKQPSD